MSSVTYEMRIEHMPAGSLHAAMITPATRPNGYQYGEERLLTVIGSTLTQWQVWARVEQYVRAQWPEDPRPIAGRSYLGHCRVRSQAERLGYREGVCGWCKRQASTLRQITVPFDALVCAGCRGVRAGEREG
ncbi:MAG: hypothetical protein Q8R78_01705 [Candidatus Omnitrophota bacterium]|nr:hypothetical protein [Candidatus Omnitrophota bacterium]